MSWYISPKRVAGGCRWFVSNPTCIYLSTLKVVAGGCRWFISNPTCISVSKLKWVAVGCRWFVSNPTCISVSKLKWVAGGCRWFVYNLHENHCDQICRNKSGFYECSRKSYIKSNPNDTKSSTCNGLYYPTFLHFKEQ